MKNKKALFLDLDGTLIKTASGRIFPIGISDWQFIPETLDAIKEYYSKGFKIIIVSNQGGIEEGYVTLREFKKKMKNICTELLKICKLAEIDLSYIFCPTMEGYKRKPNPGMAYEAALEYELDLNECVMFGDMESDKEFAFNSNISLYFGIEDVISKYRNAQGI